MDYYSTRIEDYVEAIAGCDAFFIAQRDHFQVINYLRGGSDVFPDPNTAPDAATARLLGLRRQCRGLIFSLAGDVISLPIQKFFNVGEREETLINNIDLSRQHVMLEKLDGSFIRPTPIDDHYRLCSKMGITDTSMLAEVWLVDHPSYDQFIKSLLKVGLIPIFEFCSRKQKVVIDYPIDRLVLLAIRSVFTGETMDYDSMVEEAAQFNVEVVKKYPGTMDGLDALVAEIGDLVGQEGIVMRFSDVSYKIKADDYRNKHNAKDSLMTEKGVIDLILTEKLDDIKSVLTDADRVRLDDFETAFWIGVTLTTHVWEETSVDVRKTYSDRKSFALAKSTMLLDGNLRGAIFKSWGVDDFDFRAAVVNTISKSLSSQTTVNEARYLWHGASWSYADTSEDE